MEARKHAGESLGVAHRAQAETIGSIYRREGGGQGLHRPEPLSGMGIPGITSLVGGILCESAPFRRGMLLNQDQNNDECIRVLVFES